MEYVAWDLQVVGMESKLKQLDAEREELEKYQKIDRERRSLEYAIHDKEVSDTRAALEQARTPGHAQGTCNHFCCSRSAFEPCDLHLMIARPLSLSVLPFPGSSAL